MAKHNEELQRRWQRFDRDESAVMVILASKWQIQPHNIANR